MKHARFVLSLAVCVAGIMLLASAVQAQNPPCPAPNPPNASVATWHNDDCRSGWQRDETNLTATGTTAINQSNFGLVSDWQGTSQVPMGAVYAEPLAVSGLHGVQGQNGQTCPDPCSLVIVADMNDVVWAYNAAPSSLNVPPPVWSLNVSQAVPGGGPVVCDSTPGSTFPPCEVPGVVIGGTVGVMGTPVIDTANNILYVAAAISTIATEFDLFAIDILNGSLLAATSITGSVSPAADPGSSKICTSTYPATGDTRTFDSGHIQRSALLFLNGYVYVAFAPSDAEWENGWVFAYSLNSNNNAFNTPVVFLSTPYGTGGGIWGSGAGPASDGVSIFTVTGNGTYDVNGVTPATVDFSDSVLKLSPPPNGKMAILDYFTPSDVLTYQPPPPLPSNGLGRCLNDTDLGSGGLMVFPDIFYSSGGQSLTLAVNADKASNIYILNTANLGKYVASGGTTSEGNNIQTVMRPGSQDGAYPQPAQGYWSSPSYWSYSNSGTNSYNLYYAATFQRSMATASYIPYPIYQFVLNTTSPLIPDSAATGTPTLFCQFSPTTSISSYGTAPGTGILWGIEHQNYNIQHFNNCDDTTHELGAALHAYNASNISNELYNSAYPSAPLTLAPPTPFATPTIFQSRVYVGAANLGAGKPSNVYVFGLCSTGPSNNCISPQQ